ncbi:MAG: GlmU family protein [Bacteroidetes bacterium]|nr:GlmU family protein [Bacteroidota bacterium]
MNHILFDDNARINLLPLTYTKPVSRLRIGILTLEEKWEKYLGNSESVITEGYLQQKFEQVVEAENIVINAAVLPNQELVSEIHELDNNEALVSNDMLIAASINEDLITEFSSATILANCKSKETKLEIIHIADPSDIFTLNDMAIRSDFDLITKGRDSDPVSNTTAIIGKGGLFIEAGAKIEHAYLNTTDGPIYIGKDAEVMEGSMIRGPFALGDHSTIKMGAKIYGATTIGPHCKVGGEVNNSVISGFSNKAHDGFLGNSVIGEWCNLGADTNTSNLKNNYGNVKLWNYRKDKFIDTGLQFCGLIMGDHSKCGINTMFNTGTVVGVSANIFGAGFQSNFIPSFGWGGTAGFTTYKLDAAFETIGKVFERRGLTLDESEKSILKSVFEATEKYRPWEKVKV